MAKDSKEKKHFFKDFKAELKKVIWPTPKQLVNNTVAVLTIVIIIAVIVAVLDLAFGRLNSLFNTGLQTLVESTNTIDENVNEVTDSLEADLVDTNAEVVDAGTEVTE